MMTTAEHLLSELPTRIHVASIDRKLQHVVALYVTVHSHLDSAFGVKKATLLSGHLPCLFNVMPGLSGYKELMSALHEVELQLKAGMPGSHQCKAQSGGKHQEWKNNDLSSHQQYHPSPVRSRRRHEICRSMCEHTFAIELVTYIMASRLPIRLSPMRAFLSVTLASALFMYLRRHNTCSENHDHRLLYTRLITSPFESWKACRLESMWACAATEIFVCAMQHQCWGELLADPACCDPACCDLICQCIACLAHLHVHAASSCC